MARRPLPRILTATSTPITRSRDIARTAAVGASDVLHPLITITRGLRRLTSSGRRRWTALPPDRRGPALATAAAGLAAIVLMPYGPLIALIALMGAAAWAGHERRTPVETGPCEAELGRLQALYEALVPYFSVAEDPSPLYAHGGEWEPAFSSYEFDDGRVSRLKLRYPPYFPDGEAESRARIEALLHAKCGRGREYLFEWDEEGNELGITVLPPLPTDICAQRFVTTPGEMVLGFTDPGGVQRTVPVAGADATRDAPPVMWRTGPRSTEPHLLALGRGGTGISTLVRSIALQALHHGDVLVVDGSGTGEYACLVERDGVLAVECGLAGAVASLEWAANETERRLIAANSARQAGRPAPEDTRRQMWILLDRPTVLSHLAAVEQRIDPQELLQVPLRHGRAVNVTVVVADQLDSAEGLAETVRSQTRARVILGAADPREVRAVLGAPPHTTPTPHVPPGRGYARLGTGPVHRLQVPATPDPFDEETADHHREAVLALLPPRPHLGPPPAARSASAADSAAHADR
ncbi:hypothetical protein ACH429_12905 [Streptomyces pathocidini]|uniref:FtsK domain-containing protein n=2 Tax=Streptomyces pathocidini TaxID=1650571 RepID=A0ABW7UWA9_9ACTN